MVIYSVIVRHYFRAFGAERRTPPILRALFQVPYPVSLAFATLAKAPGVWGYSSHFGKPSAVMTTRTCISLKSFLFTFLRTLWHEAKLNSFLFKRLRTLYRKTPGVGGGDRQSLPKLTRSQHGKFGNRESQCRPQEHIRWEVRLGRHPGKADCARRAVCHPWHPAMLPITMREHRRNGKRRCRVTGRKARARAAEVFMTAEKCIGEIASRRDVRRTQPPRRHLHHNVHDGAIGVSFAGKQRGMFRVRIVAEMSHYQKRCGNNGHSQRCIAAGKYVVESAKNFSAASARKLRGPLLLLAAFAASRPPRRFVAHPAQQPKDTRTPSPATPRSTISAKSAAIRGELAPSQYSLFFPTWLFQKIYRIRSRTISGLR